MKIELMQTPRFERKNYGGTRHYVSRNYEGRIDGTAIGVTSWIGKVTPPSKELDSFKMSFGSETAYWFAMDTMAYYGTIMHIVCEDIFQDRPINLSDEYITQMFKLNEVEKEDGGLKKEYQHVHLPATVGKKVYNAKRFRKDAIAIKTFYDNIEDEIGFESKSAIEQEFTLVGIETTFADFESGYAGTVDIIVKHDIKYKMKDGKPNSITYHHILDLKTGHAHYLGHELQLMAYRNMVAKYLETENIYMHDLYMKDYRDSTFTKFLNGKSKTKPYTLVTVDYNKEKFSHYYDSFFKWSDYKKPNLSEKEINYNKPLDEIIKQIKGE